jgi:hypothetical protein
MLDPYLARLHEMQTKKGGIKLSKFKSGTKVVVTTLYNTYEITIIDGQKVKVKGGRHFVEEAETVFTGSSWGGSMLKTDWIGHDMRMEFAKPPRGLRTSRVVGATVIGPDWSYEMDWP